MATRKVNLEFCPMSAKDVEIWKTTDELPEDLFGPLSLQTTRAHRARLIPAVTSMLSAYQTECNTKIISAGSICVNCEDKAITAFPRPISFLHLTAVEREEGPLIRVYVIPLCKKSGCKRQAIAINDDIMDRTLEEQKAQVAPGKRCPCGVSVGTKACAKCKVASYCGKEHQKRDYKEHKKICHLLQSMREMSEGQRMWFREGEEAASSSEINSPSSSSSTSKSTPAQSEPTIPEQQTPSSSETTRTVRVNCVPIGGAPEWDTTVELPVSLIEQSSKTQSDSYRAAFVAAMNPFHAKLRLDLDTKSGPTCLVCKTAPTTYGASFCMNMLDTPDQFLMISTVPTCGSPECREEAEEWNEMFQQDLFRRNALKACKVCDKEEGLKKCVKCKSVAYCGEGHQKQDWSSHKRECKQLAKDRRDSAW